MNQALTHQGSQRQTAIRDALLFRAYRRSLFPKADAEERALEMHEGLAEYTGVTLSGSPDIDMLAASKLEQAEMGTSFVRSFAYASGPAYGVLLDESKTNWRKGLKPTDDLGDLLSKTISIKMPQDIRNNAAQASKNYDAVSLRASEIEREDRRKKVLAVNRARFVDGPVIEIPLQKMSMQFNPNNLQPLDSLGTVYPDIKIVDVWGILTVSNGALLNATFTGITVSAPDSNNLQSPKGDGSDFTVESRLDDCGWKTQR